MHAQVWNQDPSPLVQEWLQVLQLPGKEFKYAALL
jgi:hypothetical protein